MKTRPNIQIKLLNQLIRASYSALKQSIDAVFLLFFLFPSKFVQYVVKVVPPHERFFKVLDLFLFCSLIKYCFFFFLIFFIFLN